MKLFKLFSYIFIIGIPTACGSVSGPGGKTQGDNILTKNQDGEEYELIIIDSGFDRWFSMNRRPVNYHSLTYYEQQNARYAQVWNERVNQQGAYRRADYPFESYVNYDPTENYGLELNYKLFYYFKYIEDVYGRRYNFPN